MAGLSLNSPEYNLREIAKNMLLLEDHLVDENKFCHDCIRKHIMMIEALADEAVSLDKEMKWVRESRDISARARRWMERFTDRDEPLRLAQDVRLARKQLVVKVHDPRIVKPRDMDRSNRMPERPERRVMDRERNNGYSYFDL